MFASLAVVVALAAPASNDAARATPMAERAGAGESSSSNAGASPERALRIAVYELENTGVDPRIARLVDRFLLVELRKLAQVSVIGMEEIQAMLDHEAAKQLMGCSADESCLADIAGSLGVDELVIGNIARVGDEHIFGLRRIDQQNAAVKGSMSRRLVAESGEEFLAAIGPAVAELYSERALRGGVTRGVDAEVALALDPPPLDPWLPLTVVVGASGLAVLGVGSLALYGLATLLAADMLAAAEETPQSWQGIARMRTASNVFAVSTWVLASGALLAGGTAALLALFTDWKGYRHAMEDNGLE